ncbi:HAD family hydrolase [Roseivivax isoporae]|uniref:Haloacid dehalogenase n=1 Tax=Roseivivax isoporae LMG 25204 TaxID=1449351 RepID=X7F5J1_9RHOB|nr:HAD-IA family hydrolase [Roseivivax isoporae]ETX28030.1 haloacid dehalogenase [Roseivivax isoporae LMG 25204]
MWDFDGVLNTEPPSGPFPWIDDLPQEMGIDAGAFRAFLRQPGLARDVLRGRRDLEEALAAWLATRDTQVSAAELHAYWLDRDARPDAETVRWLDAAPQRAVIGTNNTVPRARYIMERMGFAARVEAIFASGGLGVAKPDAGFWRAIEDWSGLSPGRILLIDDARANVAAARGRGWQAFHFTAESRARLPALLGIDA